LQALKLRIADESPASADAVALLDALSIALADITGSSGIASFDPRDVAVPGACFVVARDAEGTALGCGAIRPLQLGVGEIKRMYARPGTAGVGSALLAHIEATASNMGYRQLWLETRLVNTRAVRFYERRGYERIANFGRYVGRAEAVCFGKTLVAAS
jgi:GNAT superfamily N-acetyltransferase